MRSDLYNKNNQRSQRFYWSRMKDEGCHDIVNIGAKKTGKVPVIRHVRC